MLYCLILLSIRFRGRARGGSIWDSWGPEIKSSILWAEFSTNKRNSANYTKSTQLTDSLEETVSECFSSFEQVQEAQVVKQVLPGQNSNRFYNLTWAKFSNKHPNTIISNTWSSGRGASLSGLFSRWSGCISLEDVSQRLFSSNGLTFGNLPFFVRLGAGSGSPSTWVVLFFDEAAMPGITWGLDSGAVLFAKKRKEVHRTLCQKSRYRGCEMCKN
jgi:hypothetical protein